MRGKRASLANWLQKGYQKNEKCSFAAVLHAKLWTQYWTASQYWFTSLTPSWWSAQSLRSLLEKII